MRLVACTLSLLGLACCGVAAAATPTVTEFSAGITPSSGLQGIAMGPDGNMWFTEFSANKIGRITPAGVVTEFPLAGNPMPYDIAAGHDGTMWFTQYNANSIGRITTAGAVLTSVTLTAGAHPVGIAADGTGRIWAAESGIDKLARVTPPSTLTEDGVGITAGATPRQITSGPDTAMWFTEANGGKLGRHGLFSSGSTEQSALSAGDAIAAGPESGLWFVDPANNRVTTLLLGAAGGLTLGAMPTSASFPEDVAAGPDGNMWITEASGNRIARFGVDSQHGEDFGTGISSASGPFGIAAGPDGAMWFTESAGRIGRITTGDGPFTFTAPGPLSFAAAGSASPYPASIPVSGLTGVVTRVRVRLNGLFAQAPEDLGALLVDPGGRSVILFDDAGAGSDAEGAVMTFTDDGRTLDGFTSGRFVPADETTLGGVFPAPAPTGPYSTSLSTFNGADPNGEWKLFLTRGSTPFPAAVDDVAGGWSLDVQTAPPQTITVAGPTQTVTGPTQTVTVLAPRDTTPAKLKVSKTASKMTLSKFLRGFAVKLTPNEPVAIDASLTGITRKATLAASVALFEKALTSSSKTRTVKVKPSKAAVGKPRKAFKVRLRLTATDRGGNRTRVVRAITVSPHKKRGR